MISVFQQLIARNWNDEDLNFFSFFSKFTEKKNYRNGCQLKDWDDQSEKKLKNYDKTELTSKYLQI